eukprot:TRINITY_DN1006_c0_g1_i2.p1 TRINITY_DN1006_c0_g1~~TRINITY_DN1006_c0_g1_i2.p1  ORF type:complete len:265 (+),score=13.03 TRINITY_DN1006_c0_g1_i2:202-996(+)
MHLWGCPEAASQMKQLVEELVMKGDSDQHIYSELRSLFSRIQEGEEWQKQIKSNDEYFATGRGNKRAQDIQGYCKQLSDFNVTSYIDVGCSEGGVTSSMGKVLGLMKEQIHGCDVITPSQSLNGDMVFSPCTADSLPYKDNQFNFATIFMSVHHMKQPVEVLREVYRILQPGSYMIIREHDCDPPEFSNLLDIIHDLYGHVWAKTITLTTESHYGYSHYYTRNQLVSLVASAGFEIVQGISHAHIIDAPNPWKYFYAIFKKPSV